MGVRSFINFLASVAALKSGAIEQIEKRDRQAAIGRAGNRLPPIPLRAPTNGWATSVQINSPHNSDVRPVILGGVMRFATPRHVRPATTRCSCSSFPIR